MTDEAGALVTDSTDIQSIVRKARREPLTQTSVQIEPYDSPGCYVVDDPETHLHPAAIMSVRNWLTALAATASTVLVATHSPILINSERNY